MVNWQFLKQLRGKIPQRELAKAAGVSFASIQRAERGNAGLNVLMALAKHFGVPVATLIKDNKDNP